jgi:hypothetical protein
MPEGRAGSATAPASTRRPPIKAWPAGTPVAVRTRFTARWAEGFVVEAPERRGRVRYRVRRVSDNAVLPATFAPEDLRGV